MKAVPIQKVLAKFRSFAYFVYEPCACVLLGLNIGIKYRFAFSYK